MRWLLVVMFCVVAVSCATVRNNGIDVSHDTLYVYNERVDSVYKYDSIYVAAVGGTVYVDKTHYMYKYLFLKDTVYSVHTDTVNVVVYKERGLTIIDKVVGWLKVFPWAILTLALLYLVARIARKWK